MADQSPDPITLADASAAEAALQGAQQVSVKSIMLGSGPRFARDAFGPVLAFYIGWKVLGLVAGIVLATGMSVLAYRHERKNERMGRMPLLSLGFVIVQAIVGLVSRSATAYLAQPDLLSGVFGVAFIVSTWVSKPLAGVFAEEMYPFPKEVKESRTFLRVFSRISLVWGVYQILRSATRLLTLTKVGVDAFVLIQFVTGVPITAALMSWSIWYGVRGFRNSDEWGWAMRGDDPPPEVVAAYTAAT